MTQATKPTILLLPLKPAIPAQGLPSEETKSVMPAFLRKKS